MIDQRLLRESPDVVRASQRARRADESVVDRLVAAENLRRTSSAQFDELRAEQKDLGRQVAKAQGDEKSALLARAKQLSDAVKAADETRESAASESSRLMLQVDNIVEPGVPEGGEEDFVLLEEVGKPRDFAAEGFEPRDHVELGSILGAIDIERAAKVSGSRFYYLTGVGALLELALVNMAMAMAVERGLTPVIPPVIVKPAAMEGTGFLGQAAENVYRLELDDAYLVGTSEVPLAALHMDEIIDAAALPIRYAGFSSCFRREAGTYGKDTRGIIRVHQFDKVEMFSFVDPAEAKAEHQRLLQCEKDFLDALEIPYRVIDVASGDLGASAARKFDIEAWIPTQDRYREVTSASNCTEFQARRLNIRVRTPSAEGSADKPTVGPVATLNGTLVAIPRVIVAILENHQQPDGSVLVPAALRPYLQNRDTITPTNPPANPPA